MDHRWLFLQKNGWCLSPKFQSNVFGSSKGLKEGFLYSFGQKTARVPWQNSFNLMLILKCQWQICLICTNIREIKFHLVYLFLPFLSRVKLNFLSIDWIQWSLWFPMNIQGLFYHFTTFAWCVSQGRWIEVILRRLRRFSRLTATGGSVGWASGCRAGGREFNSGRTNIQGLKITE